MRRRPNKPLAAKPPQTGCRAEVSNTLSASCVFQLKARVSTKPQARKLQTPHHVRGILTQLRGLSQEKAKEQFEGGYSSYGLGAGLTGSGSSGLYRYSIWIISFTD